MENGTITTLAPDKLYALQNVCELDGRLSSYATSARGSTVSNCYAPVEDDSALMLDTGFTVHRDAILGQLKTLLSSNQSLSLMPLRINEFMSVCNAAAIGRQFAIENCYGPFPDLDKWLVFDGVPEIPALPTVQLGAHEKLQVGKNSGRFIEVFNAPIRLINTYWLYDTETRTLFTSDMFTHFWRDRADGPWVAGDNDAATTAPHLRSHLLNSRFWWLEGAQIDGLRRAVGEVFERYDVETIAPGYGCVLYGRDRVQQEYETLDAVMRDLDRSATAPHYVAYGEVR